jgi:hypothetical protein
MEELLKTMIETKKSERREAPTFQEDDNEDQEE